MSFTSIVATIGVFFIEGWPYFRVHLGLSACGVGSRGVHVGVAFMRGFTVLRGVLYSAESPSLGLDPLCTILSD